MLECTRLFSENLYSAVQAKKHICTKTPYQYGLFSFEGGEIK